MISSFSTGGFLIRLKEENIQSDLLWENHCHAGYEMIAVLSGDIRITLESREYRLTEGDAIVIPPLCYHIISANKKSLYRRLTVDFDSEAIPSPLRSIISEKNPYPFHTGGGRLHKLAEICSKDSAEFYSPLAEAVLIELLYAAADSVGYEEECSDDPMISNALLYIENNLCESITLDGLALYLSCSKSLLCHRFKEKMKISPKQYVLQKRLALAAKLIREGTPPMQAALRVGYENYSDFYRVYKKYLSASPSES